jgi:hypothetical protein
MHRVVINPTVHLSTVFLLFYVLRAQQDTADLLFKNSCYSPLGLAAERGASGSRFFVTSCLSWFKSKELLSSGFSASPLLL